MGRLINTGIFSTCDIGFKKHVDIAVTALVHNKNLLFGKIFAENCMQLKEIGLRGGASLLRPFVSTKANSPVSALAGLGFVSYP